MTRRLSHAIWLAGLLVLGIAATARAVDDAPLMLLAQAQPAPSPSPTTQAPGAAAPADQQGAVEEPIGNVATMTGVATVTRNNTDTPLQLKDDIYLNDIVKTQASSSLSITFSDATTFRLSANAQVTIDNYVYEDKGGNNAGAFDIARGTIAFVAASVAKTGTMQITTPTATLGIRGTTGLVEVPEGATATSASNVNIKLYPDADGRVGQIEVNDRQGGRLGALTQGASGFAIRPGAAGARFAAVPITISTQQQQRDQGFVRQVHAAQTTGRRIVTEQRAFRRANPNYVNPNAPRRQAREPQQRGQTRPGQPGQQQPGAPGNRQGQQLQPRPGPAQPDATPPRGQTTTPAAPAKPGATPQPGAKPVPPAQPATAPRSGQNTLPPTSPPKSASPPRLPQGQPLLRQQPGRPQLAPGAPRTGFQNKPAKPRPAPKDKKQR